MCMRGVCLVTGTSISTSSCLSLVRIPARWGLPAFDWPAQRLSLAETHLSVPQVLRYDRQSGQGPLLLRWVALSSLLGNVLKLILNYRPMSETPESLSCQHCAGKLTFEFQLLPSLGNLGQTWASTIQNLFSIHEKNLFPSLKFKTTQLSTLQSLINTIVSVSQMSVKGLDGPPVEFGTVLVYTCHNSCWDDRDQTPRRETVILQQEAMWW